MSVRIISLSSEEKAFADTLEVQVELSDNSLLESFGMIQDLQNSINIIFIRFSAFSVRSAL